MEGKIIRNGLFKVFPNGEIYRKRKGVWEKAKPFILTPNRNRPNILEYEVVSTNFNGKQTHNYVHRLIAEALIPNPENKPQVAHIDGNSLNNKPENLVWVTSKERAQMTVDMGRGRKLEDAGVPCTICGGLTVNRDGICPKCKNDKKIYERQLEKLEKAREKFKDVKTDYLSKKEQIIVEMRMEDKTLQEIGDRLGMTRERVRQLESVILARNTDIKDVKNIIGKDVINVGEIAHIRKLTGVNISQMSSKLNISRATFEKYEANPSEFKVKHIQKLMEILGIKIEVLEA